MFSIFYYTLLKRGVIAISIIKIKKVSFLICTICITFLLFNSCVKILTSNVPEEEYTQKLESIKTMDEKNEGFDLLGWSYEKKVSSDLDIVHRYYYYPSEIDGAAVIVFLHGLNIDGRLFLHLNELADEYELISYDFPETTDLYTGDMEDFVLILNDFFYEMNFNNIVLAGTSFGGIIAIKYYASDKNVNIKKMILMALLPGGITSRDRRRMRIVARMIDGLPDYRFYFILEKLIERDSVIIASTAYPNLSTFISVRNIDWYRQIVNSLNGYNAGSDALNVDCPVLAIHGDEDETVDVNVSKEIITEYIPQSTFIIIPAGNHGIVYERSAEVAGFIREFLK